MIKSERDSNSKWRRKRVSLIARNFGFVPLLLHFQLQVKKV